ncbi:MAG: Holliday junction branch migration protein RuvA [Acidimicrobiaceae bacterium]|nr:Holliday junction branch migration protein RuvA [Acidimicrobiaceae bacterium]
MIGWLSGRVVHLRDNGALIVDVQGVGYELNVAAPDGYRVGQNVEMHVFTVVRSDAIVLYGFASSDDRDLFELLLVTPGVGPSTALAALRTMPRDELAAAIEGDDLKKLSSIPGVGSKTASRIALELKGKLSVGASYEATSAVAVNGAIEDALRALGYSIGEIRQSLSGITLSEDESTALREALQLLRRS